MRVRSNFGRCSPRSGVPTSTVRITRPSWPAFDYATNPAAHAPIHELGAIDPDALHSALDAGILEGFAWTYLREGDHLDELLRHATTTNASWREMLLSRALHVPMSAPTLSVPDLSSSELRILQMLPSHRTMAEISDAMYVSVNTVKTHVRGLYGKLQVGTRSEAVLRATEIGLIHPA